MIFIVFGNGKQIDVKRPSWGAHVSLFALPLMVLTDNAGGNCLSTMSGSEGGTDERMARVFARLILDCVVWQKRPP